VGSPYGEPYTPYTPYTRGESVQFGGEPYTPYTPYTLLYLIADLGLKRILVYLKYKLVSPWFATFYTSS
jgi:hypothetical protein